MRKEYLTAYDYYDTLLCVCGVSMHDHPQQRRGHEERGHYRGFPASYTRYVRTPEGGWVVAEG